MNFINFHISKPIPTASNDNLPDEEWEQEMPDMLLSYF